MITIGGGSIVTNWVAKFWVHTKRVLVAVLATALLLWGHGALACVPQAKTEMEALFCKVKARKPGALPYSLREFRKNPVATQYHLLRRHAERLGLAIKAPKPTKPQPVAANSKSSDVPSPGPKTRPNVTQPALMSMPEPQGRSFQAQGCTLHGEEIVCADERYRLQGNQPNSELKASVFSSELLLPPPPGPKEGPEVLNHYLLKSYQSYLQAMVGIGLAGATMSFTKFFHTYQEVSQQGSSFHARMHTMFEFLKKDKASMAVQRHFTQARPTSIKQCTKLTPSLWVCDDVKHNWVYLRQ